MTSVKSVFRSKTIWANSLALGIALWQYYVAPISGADPQVFALAVAAINLGLRFLTTQPVTL
jgi:precorrin-3B methylase